MTESTIASQRSGRPRKSLFKLPMFQLFGWRTYDVMPDGRFVMILRPVDGEAASPAATVAQNWRDTSKRLVPVK